MPPPLSDNAKWIISTLLVIVTVVITAGATSWGLGQTLATKSDLEGLATSDQLNTTTQALQGAVRSLRDTVTRLETTVGRLEDTVDGLQTAVGDVEETNAAVRTLVGVTLPAIFACMVDLSVPRGEPETEWPDSTSVLGTADRVVLSGICRRLQEDLAAVGTPLIPRF